MTTKTKFEVGSEATKKTPQILTPKDTYTIDYPWAVELADKQNSVFWTHDEIDLEKSLNDIKVETTEAERHGILTVLRLFVKYELKVNEYWSGYVAKTFCRPDIQRMAASFSFFETNVHAPVYNRINELLNLDTDEFYNSYIEDPVLKARVDFLDEALASSDPLYNIAVFSMIEGAVLYSSFAFLKHFQTEGKNLMKDLVAVINFSVRDENLHSIGGASLYQQLLKESELSSIDLDLLHLEIIEAAKQIRKHEHKIVDMIFEKGNISNINKRQMKTFIDSRINLCLNNLGINSLFEAFDNKIAEWFYKGISAAKIHDFFNTQGNNYHRKWSELKFSEAFEKKVKENQDE